MSNSIEKERKGSHLMKEFLQYLISFFVASILSDLIFGFFGFEYDMFRDDFDLLSLIIDVGVFLAIGLVTLHLLKKYIIKDKE
jgi:hypothetical protein